MLKKIIFLTSLLIILLLAGIPCFNFFGSTESAKGEVDSEQKAIKIAQVYIFDKYHQKFEEYHITTELNGDIWFVSYVTGDPLVEGGGGPTVQIRKADGKVISCLLQK